MPSHANTKELCSTKMVLTLLHTPYIYDVHCICYSYKSKKTKANVLLFTAQLSLTQLTYLRHTASLGWTLHSGYHHRVSPVPRHDHVLRREDIPEILIKESGRTGHFLPGIAPQVSEKCVDESHLCWRKTKLSATAKQNMDGELLFKYFLLIPQLCRP